MDANVSSTAAGLPQSKASAVPGPPVGAVQPGSNDATVDDRIPHQLEAAGDDHLDVGRLVGLGWDVEPEGPVEGERAGQVGGDEPEGGRRRCHAIDRTAGS